MKRLISILSVFLCAVQLCVAQNAGPSLPKADNITKGVLPNGIEYCLVSSKLDRGRADFALVQRLKADDPELVREFASVSNKLKNGSTPVIERREDAALLRFRSVPVFDKTITDSTLLAMVNMMKSSYFRQTLVVAGDIDRQSLLEQIQLMSLSVGQSDVSAVPSPVAGKSHSGRTFRIIDSRIDSLARLRFTYSSPRLSNDMSVSVVPYLTNLMYSQLGIIMESQIRSAFKAESIPLATLQIRHLDSFHSSSDEQFIIELTISPDDFEQAMNLCSRVFFALASDGVTSQEVKSSNLLVSGDGMAGAMNLPQTNSEYVDFCVTSILYGFEIPSFQSVSSFFDNKKMPVEKTIPIFNRFCSAMFSDSGGLDVEYSSNCGVLPSRAEEIFDQGWVQGVSEIPGAAPVADTSRIKYPSAKRVKLKSVASDPLTGGEIWSFANGFRVIYKKDQTFKGEFQYGVFIRGGVQNIPEYGAGEAAWASDMFDVYEIAGMDPVQFRTFFQARGVSYRCIGDFFDFRIVGKAYRNAAPEMIRCLSTLYSQRDTSKANYKYFVSCEALRESLRRYSQSGTTLAAWNELCPESPYSVFKTTGSLSDDLPLRYGMYFTQQFERFQDGVMVIIGDVDAEQLKTLLSKTIGSFPSVRHSYPRARPRINLPRKWKTTFVDESNRQYGPEGTTIQIDMLSKAAITPRNRFAFELLKIILADRLSETVSPMGYSAFVSGNIRLFPQESMAISICLKDGQRQGLVTTATTSDARIVLNSVRQSFETLLRVPVSKEELDYAKIVLLNRYNTQKENPANLRDAVMMRYSQGWDCFSGNAQMINAINPATLINLLKPMSVGTRCEYIVK